MRGAFLVVVVVALVSGCVDKGDFGRPKHSLWNDTILPGASYAAAVASGETPSSFNHTDDESELRDRAFRFLSPPHDRMVFLGLFAGDPGDVTRYHRALSGERHRSPASRYHRLAQDVNEDRGLILPFRAAAGRVASADSVRMRTAELSRRIGQTTREHAALRVAENGALIEKVRRELRLRLKAYRHALDNLVVEEPAPEAVEAERAINALEAELAWLDRIPTPPLDCGRCGGMPGGSLAGPNFGKGKPEVLPLPPPSEPARPMVLKY